MNGWIGVDFDGTLAHYDGFKGPTVLGEPIPAMVERVQRWLTEGRDVRIFTARVWPIGTIYERESDHDERRDEAFMAGAAIEEWCLRHLGRILPITCVKDFQMLELWDDRCIQVEKNTGRQIGDVRRDAVSAKSA